MRGVRVRSLVLMAAGLSWLAGCETVSRTGETPAATASLASADPAATGSVPGLPGWPVFPGSDPEKKPDLLGTDPSDDLSVGKQYYRQGSFGLAERHFRKAAELNPRDAEAWIGLAAAYDQLKRFDLADRAYDQAIKLVGTTAEVLNNRGYSYMLRGDFRRARETLMAAAARDPQNPYVQNNLRMLGEASRKAKGIN